MWKTAYKKGGGKESAYKKGAVIVPAKSINERLIKETDANKDYHVAVDTD